MLKTIQNRIDLPTISLAGKNVTRTQNWV
jgi:hypothetical protein